MNNISLFSFSPNRFKRQEQQPEENSYRRLLDENLVSRSYTAQSDQFRRASKLDNIPTLFGAPKGGVQKPIYYSDYASKGAPIRTSLNPKNDIVGRISNKFGHFPLINRLRLSNNRPESHHIPDVPPYLIPSPSSLGHTSVSNFDSYLAVSDLSIPNASLHSGSQSEHPERSILNESLYGERSDDADSFQPEPHINNPFHSPRSLLEDAYSFQAEPHVSLSVHSLAYPSAYPVGIGDGADYFEPGLFENQFTWPMGELREKQATSRIVLDAIAKNPKAVHVSVIENSPAFQVALDDFLANPKASARPVEMMLAHAANPNQMTSRNTPVLTAAIRANHPRAFKMFLNLPKTNINKQDLLGFTPLSTAVICNNDFAFKKLMQRHADVMIKDSTGRTALDWAALMGRADMLKDLLKTWQARLYLNNSTHEQHTTLPKKQDLIQLVRQQQDIIKLCKSFDEDQKRALAIRLVDHRQLPEFMAILSSGLDTDMVKSGKLLAGTGHDLYLDIATALIAAGSTPNVIAGPDNESILSYAIFGKHTQIAHLLLNAGADPSPKDNKGENSLHYAAIEGLHELVKPLLNAGGIRIDETNHAGDTALTLAYGPRHETTMLELIKAGANVKHKGSKSTPFSNALCWDQADALKAILDAGVDPNGDDKKMSALMRSTDPKVIQHLLTAGAEVNRLDEDGETALIKAVNQYAADAVQVLLKGGAKVKVGRHSALDALIEPMKPSAQEIVQLYPMLTSDEIAENIRPWQEQYDEQKSAYDRIKPLLIAAHRKESPSQGNNLISAFNYFKPTLFRDASQQPIGNIEDNFYPKLFQEPKVPFHRKLLARFRPKSD